MEADMILPVLRSLWVLWMMALFTGILFWALRPANRSRFETAAAIPLRDEE
ncbi:cbb3-type cytochrome oxidase subunit 3 [Arenibaculum pallidiluteum]|uniref:cbb3-type cytochrome oxidase subunit 3 n=1 Tax=Arenibaculum pallidiluteum TaxID=2812559 RepID=UPI001A969AB3|nr:cbb3-type cytochrome c oxidase subunit 3 [Arenibaculum pallidiluteum]